jgi:outer membrane protein TolC
MQADAVFRRSQPAKARMAYRDRLLALVVLASLVVIYSPLVSAEETPAPPAPPAKNEPPSAPAPAKTEQPKLEPEPQEAAEAVADVSTKPAVPSPAAAVPKTTQPSVNFDALTLEDCRALAVTANIDLQRSIIDNRSQELTLWNQEGLYLPDLDLSFNHNHDADSQSASVSLGATSPFGTSISVSAGHDWDLLSADSDVTLSVTQPILRNSTRTEKLDTLWKARLDAAVQRNLLERKLESLYYDVHSRYIDCIRQQLTIEVNKQALERTIKLYEATREKERLGMATVLDLADAESTLASRRIALASSQQALDDALDALKRFLDIDVEKKIGVAPASIALEESEDETSRTRIKVDEPALAILLEKVKKSDGAVIQSRPVFEAAYVNPELAMSRALVNRLDLVNAKLSFAKSYLDAVTSRLGLKPELDLTFNYTKSGSGPAGSDTLPLTAESWSAGLNLNIPIGNRAARSAFETALLNYQDARLSVREAEQGVRADVRSILRDMDTTGRNVLSYALQVRSAGLGLESARVTYELGKTDFFRVLDAENALLSAQTNYITTYLSYELLLSQLHLTIGDDSGRLPELVKRGRELSRLLRENLAPVVPDSAIRKLYLHGAPADAPFRFPPVMVEPQEKKR